MGGAGAAEDQLAAWREVAAGWERQRSVIWQATRGLSERLVGLLDPQPGETVLELAAGPGDTGFLAAERLGASGRLISTDVAPEMLEVARRRAAELGVANADFRVVDAAAIELPDRSVDGVLCRFGVMLVPDCGRALAEIGRVLRQRGRAALAVWAQPERNEWITAAGRAAVALGLLEPPAPDAPGPFRLSDPVRLRELVEHAGLRVEVLEEAEIVWRAASLDEWWEVVRDTSRTIATLLDGISTPEAGALRRAAGEGLAQYTAPDGSLTVPGAARVVLAVLP